MPFRGSPDLTNVSCCELCAEASPGVLGLAHRFEVVGIDALADTAEVIDLHSERDRPSRSLISEPMGVLDRLTRDMLNAVAVVSLGQEPDMAGRIMPSGGSRVAMRLTAVVSVRLPWCSRYLASAAT